MHHVNFSEVRSRNQFNSLDNHQCGDFSLTDWTKKSIEILWIHYTYAKDLSNMVGFDRTDECNNGEIKLPGIETKVKTQRILLIIKN